MYRFVLHTSAPAPERKGPTRVRGLELEAISGKAQKFGSILIMAIVAQSHGAATRATASSSFKRYRNRGRDKYVICWIGLYSNLDCRTLQCGR